MVNISTFGDSAIKFTFTDSDHYLYGNGEITVPVNSLLLVVDESDMVTFKKPDGDSFISFNISNSNFASKAALEAFYKENMTGGGGLPTEEIQQLIDQSISGMADNASYDSVSQEIKFYNGNTEVYSVDASDFVIDGMIDDVRIETISGVTYLVIDFNTASGKEDIQIPLTDIFDPSNYYTKAEIDASLSGKQDTLIEGVGINIDDNVISVENPTVYLTQAEYDALVSGGTVDPDTYYVISDATAIDINQYYTSAQTESAITAAVSGKQDTLSAGTGIEIDSANTISCTVTPPTYSAGRGINISNNTISTNLNVYSGQGVASVSLCNPSGTGNGESSIAGMASVGGGFQVTTKSYGETAFGVNNQSNGLSTSMSLSSGATLFSVGNGTGNTKHNAFEIRQNGDIYITSGDTDIKLQDNLGSTIEVSSAVTSGDTNPVQGGVLYDELRVIKDVETKVELEFNNSKISTNFPSGCTKIEVSNFAQYQEIDLCFEGMGGVYGQVAWVDINNGEVSVHEEIEGCNPIYTISGDNLILTWTNVSQTSKWVSNIIYYSNGTIQPEINAILSETQIVPLINQVSNNTSGITTLSSEVSEMGEVTARALIDINDKFDGLKLQQISQADYDALVSGGTVDNSTLYIITNVVN